MPATITPQLGKRKAGSVASRLVAFFEANPDEELTIPDAAAKFSVSEGAIHMALYRETLSLEVVKIIRRVGKRRGP